MVEIIFILQVVTVVIIILIILLFMLHPKSKPMEKNTTLAEGVFIAVVAAEQIYPGSGRGEEKKAYVIEFLVAKGYVDSIDKEVEILIEDAVHSLKNRSIS